MRVPRRTVSTSSPAVSRRSSSRTASARTSSRTSGCTTDSDGGSGNPRMSVETWPAILTPRRWSVAPTAFMDADHVPTEGEIAEALGHSARHWERLTTHIVDAYGIEPTYVPPSRNYGWDVKYRKGGKTLVSLTPDRGGFTALVVLGEKETDAARELDLGDHVRRVFEDARQLRDGRWLFVSVESARDVADIEALLAVKRKPRDGSALTPGRLTRPSVDDDESVPLERANGVVVEVVDRSCACRRRPGAHARDAGGTSPRTALACARAPRGCPAKGTRPRAGRRRIAGCAPGRPSRRDP